MTLKIIENLFVFLLSVASVCDSLHYTTTRSTTTQRQRSRRQPLRLMPIEDLITSPFSSTVAADYVYTPPDVGVEIYAGTIIAVLPFIWASIKFGNRISIQRNCLVCKGSGLVYVTSSNTPLSRPRKCWSCGGILPWLGWKMFWFSTFFDIGNGGVLLQPSENYEETQEKIRRGEVNYNNSGEKKIETLGEIDNNKS